MFDDRPSILLGLLRFLLGAAALTLAGYGVRMHDDAVDRLTRWDAPSPDTLATGLVAANVVLGVLLLIGLLPRASALLLLAEMAGLTWYAGNSEGELWWVAPPIAAALLLIVVLAGGGRFALIDRVDPRPRRMLARNGA